MGVLHPTDVAGRRRGLRLHEPLRRHSADTRQVLAWVISVGEALDEPSFTDSDLVHFDFHHRNALQDENGQLVAVVDWEGARRGDAAFDLVTLAFGLVASTCSAAARDRVWDEAQRRAAKDVLVAYVAHVTLRRLDWTIRFHPSEIEFWLTACREFIERVE